MYFIVKLSFIPQLPPLQNHSQLLKYMVTRLQFLFNLLKLHFDIQF